MKKLQKLAITILVFGLAAMAGCSDDNDPSGPSGPAVPAHSATSQDGDLELSIGTDKASYAFGEMVTVTMSLRNTGNAPIDLDFNRGTPARYSNLVVNVDDSGGTAHFVDGDGTADTTTLAAGASITYSWTWDQVSRLSRNPVDRGFMEVIGVTSFDDRDLIRVNDLFIELK